MTPKLQRWISWELSPGQLAALARDRINDRLRGVEVVPVLLLLPETIDISSEDAGLFEAANALLLYVPPDVTSLTREKVESYVDDLFREQADENRAARRTRARRQGSVSEFPPIREITDDEFRALLDELKNQGFSQINDI